MSEVTGYVCETCGKSCYNQPALDNHKFLSHDLPDMIAKEDPLYSELAKSYAYHSEMGDCPKHGHIPTICVHPKPESSMNELNRYCFPCIVEKNHKSAGDKGEGGDVENGSR